jgi:hypothetical protein
MKPGNRRLKFKFIIFYVIFKINMPETAKSSPTNELYSEKGYDADLILLANSPFNKRIFEKAKADKKPPEIVLKYVMKGLDEYIKRQVQMAENMARSLGEQMAEKYKAHAKEIEKLAREIADESIPIEERYKRFDEYLQKHRPA